MAKFVRCSCEETEQSNVKINNNPINIDLIVQIKKSENTWFPKTPDSENIPAITFYAINGKYYEWVYAKNQINDRDNDYDNIINNNS